MESIAWNLVLEQGNFIFWSHKSDVLFSISLHVNHMCMWASSDVHTAYRSCKGKPWKKHFNNRSPYISYQITWAIEIKAENRHNVSKLGFLAKLLVMENNLVNATGTKKKNNLVQKSTEGKRERQYVSTVTTTCFPSITPTGHHQRWEVGWRNAWSDLVLLLCALQVKLVQILPVLCWETFPTGAAHSNTLWDGKGWLCKFLLHFSIYLLLWLSQSTCHTDHKQPFIDTCRDRKQL